MPGVRLSYRYAGTTELGHFSAVKADTSVYPDGFVATVAQDDVVLGLCEKGVLPEGVTGYSGGQVTGVTGTAWPANAVPASPQGAPRTILLMGDRAPYVAAGVVARSHHLIASATPGELASAETLGIASGTKINCVGIADDAAAAAGDIAHIIVNPQQYTMP